MIYFANSYLFSFPALPVPTVNITNITVGIAGDDLNWTCSVTVVEHLTVRPTVQWSGGSVGSGNGVMVGDTTHSGVMSMRTLTFSPLRTSHGGRYFCEGIINVPMIMLRKTGRKETILQVECK